jgi:hypothetical protein
LLMRPQMHPRCAHGTALRCAPDGQPEPDKQPPGRGEAGQLAGALLLLAGNVRSVKIGRAMEP